MSIQGRVILERKHKKVHEKREKKSISRLVVISENKKKTSVRVQYNGYVYLFCLKNNLPNPRVP